MASAAAIRAAEKILARMEGIYYVADPTLFAKIIDAEVAPLVGAVIRAVDHTACIDDPPGDGRRCPKCGLVTAIADWKQAKKEESK